MCQLQAIFLNTGQGFGPTCGAALAGMLQNTSFPCLMLPLPLETLGRQTYPLLKHEHHEQTLGYWEVKVVYNTVTSLEDVVGTEKLCK